MSISPFSFVSTTNKGIFAYLSEDERLNLSQTCKFWRHNKINFESRSFKDLKDRIQKGGSVYLNDETGRHEETLGGILGAGGSKKAVALTEGRALIIPNMDTDPLKHIVPRWKRMVYEEVKMSKFLTEIGILNPVSKKVSLSISEDPFAARIPAYVCETFDSLASTKGCFIIDIKNPLSSTWQQDENFLFDSEEDRLADSNWDSVLDSLLTDVSKMLKYGIKPEFDSLNLAIVKKPSTSTKCQYEVRYFGFDFSSKYHKLTLPSHEASVTSPDLDQAVALFDLVLSEVFFSEFGFRSRFGADSEKLQNLKKHLILKYAPVILSKLT